MPRVNAGPEGPPPTAGATPAALAAAPAHQDAQLFLAFLHDLVDLGDRRPFAGAA